MRRILKKIAANDLKDFGDVSTLTDLSVVDTLIKNRKNLWFIKINIYSHKYLWKIINFIDLIINLKKNNLKIFSNIFLKYFIYKNS